MVQHADIDHTGLPGVGGGGSGVAVRVTRNASLNVGTSEAAIVWDNEVRDDGGLWEGVTNPSRITIPSTGWYLIGAALEAGSTAGDWWQGYLRLGGATNLQFDIYFQTTTSTKALQWCQLRYMTAAEYVEIYAQAQATTAITVGVTANFWAIKLAD